MLQKNKFTLITGATGFVGSKFLDSISHKRNNIITISRENSISKNTLKCDLSTEIPDLYPYTINEVYHFCGLAHKFNSDDTCYNDFYRTNVIGTLNLLKALEKNIQKDLKILFLSSVSVYGLYEGTNIAENTPKIAEDPYGKTKSIAEEIIIKFCSKYSIQHTIIRPPLIVGPNPKGNLQKLFFSISKSRYVSIKNNSALKSVVGIDDLVNYLPLAINVGGIYNLTDNVGIKISELEDEISQLASKRIYLKIPIHFFLLISQVFSFVECICKTKLFFNLTTYHKLTRSLTFSSDSATKSFGWKPTPVRHRVADLLNSSKTNNY